MHDDHVVGRRRRGNQMPTERAALVQKGRGRLGVQDWGVFLKIKDIFEILLEKGYIKFDFQDRLYHIRSSHDRGIYKTFTLMISMDNWVMMSETSTLV